MYAVVTHFNTYADRKRLKLTPMGNTVLIRAGKKVSRRRLKKALRPFGQRYLSEFDTSRLKLAPFDTAKPLKDLLFTQFCEYILSRKGIGISVGVFDTAGEYLDSPLLTRVIVHTASVTVFTLREAEERCREWLSATGTCPEIVQKKAWLFGCDCVFAPQGLAGFQGEVFGRGGRDIDPALLKFDPKHAPLLSADIDRASLWCLLQAAESEHPEHTKTPEYY